MMDPIPILADGATEGLEKSETIFNEVISNNTNNNPTDLVEHANTTITAPNTDTSTPLATQTSLASDIPIHSNPATDTTNTNTNTSEKNGENTPINNTTYSSQSINTINPFDSNSPLPLRNTTSSTGNPFDVISSPTPFISTFNSAPNTTTNTTTSTGASLDWWDSEFVHISPKRVQTGSNSATPFSEKYSSPVTSPKSFPFIQSQEKPFINTDINANNNYVYYNTNTSNHNTFPLQDAKYPSPITTSTTTTSTTATSFVPLSSNDYLLREFEAGEVHTTTYTATSTSTTSTTWNTTSNNIIEDDEEALRRVLGESALEQRQTIPEKRTISISKEAAAGRDVDPIEESVIDEIASMLSDFSREKIREVVRLTQNDMEKSLQLLLDGGLQSDEPHVDNFINTNQEVDSKPYGNTGPSYPPQPEKPHNRNNNRSFHDEEEDSDEEYDHKPKKNGSGLTDSQEILLMLQQEEALAEIRRKREEDLSMELIKSFQSEQMAVQDRREQENADNQALISMLESENKKESEARKQTEEQYEKMLNDMLAEERAKLQAQLDAKTYECQICFSDVKIEDMYTLEECHHRFCFDCVDNYLSTAIKDGHSNDIKCPSVGCKHMITFEEVKQVVSVEVLDKYETFLLRAYLMTDPNCRWCPRPGCGTAMIGSADNPMLVCPNQTCNFAFCFKCRDEWHHDATCEEYQKWKDMVENGTEEEEDPEEPETTTPTTPTTPTPTTPNRGRNGRGRGGRGRGGRTPTNVTTPIPTPTPVTPAPLTARQIRNLRSPNRRGNLLQMVSNYFRPESPAPASPPTTTTTDTPNTNDTDNTNNTNNTDPANASPPKPKVTVAQKMAEKPEGVSFREWIVSQMSENSSQRKVKAWIQKNTKQCPQCQAPIEKNGGCNHMTCAGCRHQFCWLCMGVYSSTHFSNGPCKQFT